MHYPEKYTLLIWVDERTRLYLIPSIVANQYKDFLVMAHNKLIHHDFHMNDGLKFVDAAICQNIEKGFEQYSGIFMQYRHRDYNEPIVDVMIEAVYSTGMVV